jgi:ketosteroid isomerase-like protein
MTTSTVNPSSESTATLAAVRQFSAAVNRHDLDATMKLMSPDCVFENTVPPPDGERFEGEVAVRHFWRQFFAVSPAATFEFEEELACGDRAVVRWVYRWVDETGVPGHVRGVDIFRVVEGKVVEKLSYVKG